MRARDAHRADLLPGRPALRALRAQLAAQAPTHTHTYTHRRRCLSEKCRSDFERPFRIFDLNHENVLSSQTKIGAIGYVMPNEKTCAYFLLRRAATSGHVGRKCRPARKLGGIAIGFVASPAPSRCPAVGFWSIRIFRGGQIGALRSDPGLCKPAFSRYFGRWGLVWVERSVAPNASEPKAKVVNLVPGSTCTWPGFDHAYIQTYRCTGIQKYT